VPEAEDLMFFTVIIFLDYFSLFPVRRCLAFAGYRPFLALFLGIITAGTIVTGALLSILSGIIIIQLRGNIFGYPLVYSLLKSVEASSITAIILLMMPAFFVHLWLPLFGLGALGVRALYFCVYAVKWLQWFLKGGDEHPIRAIGIVAAAFMFAGTATIRLLPPVQVPRRDALNMNIEMYGNTLSFVKVTATRTPDGLTIEGDIVNSGKTARNVPRLRVLLRDAAEREVQVKIVDPPVFVLAPGQIAHFKTPLEHAEKTVTSVLMEFLY
jgi:hypothetical protein